jgi:hypothetical protein
MCNDVSGMSSKKNVGCCNQGHTDFPMLQMMLMRYEGKAGVDVWSSCGRATNVCCRAKAGRAVVIMTCGRAIGLITRVWSVAVATGVDQETFRICVVL